jgi:hypothetical protein
LQSPFQLAWIITHHQHSNIVEHQFLTLFRIWNRLVMQHWSESGTHKLAKIYTFKLFLIPNFSYMFRTFKKVQVKKWEESERRNINLFRMRILTKVTRGIRICNTEWNFILQIERLPEFSCILIFTELICIWKHLLAMYVFQRSHPVFSGSLIFANVLRIR